jgi:hypothetical protein
MLIYVFQHSVSQHSDTAGYDFINVILNPMGGSGGNDGVTDVAT